MARIITAPPQTITKDDHGAYILILTALLTTWSILFLLIRAVVRRIGPNQHFASDDVAATIATVLGCIQATLVMIAVDHAGLGNRLSTISVDELHRTALLVYASNTMWPIAVASSKIAMTELTARLSMHRRHLIACRAISAVSAVWGIASMLAIAIGCHSHPWDMLNRCSNLPTSWITIGVFDAITEVCLFLVPLFMIWPLSMPLRSKAIVLIAFGSRLPLIAVIIVRLIYLYGIRYSTDYTWDLTMPIILSQVEMHYGLYAMTLPCLRPLLKVLNTGMLATCVAQVEIRPDDQGTTRTTSAQSADRLLSRQCLDTDSISIYKSRKDSFGWEVSGKERPLAPLPVHLDSSSDSAMLPIVLHPSAAEQEDTSDEIVVER